jgi:hypothetical protein
MTTDTGIIAFLNARLDEDEEYAKQLLVNPALRDISGMLGLSRRLLREVEAKRRIVDDYRITVNAVRNVTGTALDTHGYHSMRGGRDALESCVALLAAIYSDHPNYRQDW